VFDVVRELANYGALVEIYDPWADSAECKHEYGRRLVKSLERGRYDAVVIAVAHREFRTLGARGARRLCKKKHVLYDIKHVFPAAEVDGRL
jgi:UDP-N-acetyl-D-galactosamine dehydrogenase